MRSLRGARPAGSMSLDAPRGTERVVQSLAAMLQATPSDLPRVLPLAPAAPPRRAIAVDGSSVVLASSGERAIVAFRAGRVGVEGGVALPADAPPAEVALTEDEPRALDVLRSKAERAEALAALGELDRGDLLLLDGSLQAHGMDAALDGILALAAQRGVDVVGVCKSTSLAIGGAPALVACQRAARGGSATWHAPLPTPPGVRGRSYAARLSAAEARPFRFDVASTREPAEVLASLAGLCGHPAYPGYPSPLAMAHNAVLINDEMRRRLLALVHEGALKAGVDPDAWDAAFVDYHDVLELGA